MRTERPRLDAFLRVLRRLAGMPDYVAYLEHAARCHPGAPVLSERDFFREYLRARYADGPSRCC